MASPCRIRNSSIEDDPLVKKLSLRGPLSTDEQTALAEAVSGQRDIGADEEFISEGSEPSYSKLLLEGFAGRFKYSADGKHQILSVHVKGDFVDLHSFLLQPMEHGVFSLAHVHWRWPLIIEFARSRKAFRI